jgi:hypothetical protein
VKNDSRLEPADDNVDLLVFFFFFFSFSCFVSRCTSIFAKLLSFLVLSSFLAVVFFFFSSSSAHSLSFDIVRTSIPFFQAAIERVLSLLFLTVSTRSMKRHAFVFLRPDVKRMRTTNADKWNSSRSFDLTNANEMSCRR